MLTILRCVCRDSIVLAWYADGVLQEHMTVLFSHN